jgi:hypothetical protein
MGDIYSDILSGGQSVIDEVAGAVGIEKGGDIDKALTTAAEIGRNVTGTSSVDSAINKLLGGSGSKTVATQTQTGSTSPSTGFFKGFSPVWGIGGAVVVGASLHFALKKWWLTAIGAIVGGVGAGIGGPRVFKPKTV